MFLKHQGVIMFHRRLLYSLLLISLLAIQQTLAMTLVRLRASSDEQSSNSQNAGKQSTGALPTVDQILDKYVQALGGVKAVQAQTSLVTRGIITVPAIDAKGTIEIYTKAPNKELTELDLSIVGTSRTGFNGTVAWEEEGGVIKDLPNYPKRDSDFYLPLKLHQLYPKLELKGKEKIGNAEAYVLEAPHGGNPKRWYFDTASGLLLRTEERNAAGKLLERTDYADYRSVDGVQIPFILSGIDELEAAYVIKFSEVKHNVQIDDAKFEKPSAK
jgi:zinc protease